MDLAKDYIRRLSDDDLKATLAKATVDRLGVREALFLIERVEAKLQAEVKRRARRTQRAGAI